MLPTPARRRIWVKFALILLLMTLLFSVSPALTHTTPFSQTEWLAYGITLLALSVAYIPLAGQQTETLKRPHFKMMVVGIVLYGVISWATNIFRYPAVATITLRLGVVVPLFMGLTFGPAVGFVTGALGNHFGDFLSGWGFFPMWNLGNGLMGFVAGLIHFERQPLAGARRLLWGAAVVLALLLISQLWGPLQPLWLGVYAWLILVIVVLLAYQNRYPRPSAAVAWGMWGVIIGMSIASVAELWTRSLSLNEMLSHNLIIIIGTNLIFTQILLPVLHTTWD